MDHNEMDDIVYEEIDDGFDANGQPSVDNATNYTSSTMNPALGYGRRPQDSFAKEKLGKKGLNNDDKNLGKNKNNQNNPSNDAAKNLATGNRKNNKPNQKKNPNQKDNHEKGNPQDKNNHAKNGSDGGKGHSLGKNGETSDEKSSSKRSGLSSLKSKLGGKGKNDKNDSPATKGIKSLWRKIPMGIRVQIILIGGAVAGLFLLFLILLTVFMGASDNAYGSVYCAGQEFDISDITVDTSTKTYTGVFDFAWDRTSGQYQFYKEQPTYIDEDGFLRSGEDYLIALGQYFGTKKGTRYLITLEDGTSFTAALADSKSKKDTLMDPSFKFHWTDASHKYANILEFEMGCGTVIDPVSYGFNFSGKKPVACKSVNEVNAVIRKKFPGNVASIQLLESDETCNFNGQFQTRNTSIYSDRKALNLLFKVAPGTKINYDYDRYTCVTYAKLRAAEIVYTATNYTDKQRKSALAKISDAQGNGWMWTVPDILNTDFSGFSFDKSCTNFQPGSIIAFSGSGASCGSGGSPETGLCGHVAIIESVDTQKKKVKLSDSYNPRGWGMQEYTYKDLKNAFGGCRGVTYLLSYNGK